MYFVSRPAVVAVFLAAFATISSATENFSACPQFFAHAKPPVVALHATDRALCYDSFAILGSLQKTEKIVR